MLAEGKGGDDTAAREVLRRGLKVRGRGPARLKREGSRKSKGDGATRHGD